jgi:predicted aspartyl protease
MEASLPGVPFDLEQDSMVLTGMVNGQPVTFVLDTGDAVGPVFTSADAARLGLAQGQAEGVEGAGGSSDVYQATASVSLGDRVFDGEACAVDPSLEGYSLLGLPFFARECSGLLLDFGGKLLVMIGTGS